MAERNSVWIAVELAFHHYEPDNFTPETLFMNVQSPGTEREHVEVFPLGSVGLELYEKQMIIRPPGSNFFLHPVFRKQVFNFFMAAGEFRRR